MRVNDNYKEVNAALQVNDPESLYSFYKKALHVRKEYKDALIYGKLEILDADNEQVFSFYKKYEGETAYVVLNFTKETLDFKPVSGNLELVLSNEKDPKDGVLSAYESRVYIVKN